MEIMRYRCEFGPRRRRLTEFDGRVSLGIDSGGRWDGRCLEIEIGARVWQMDGCEGLKIEGLRRR